VPSRSVLAVSMSSPLLPLYSEDEHRSGYE
jgi:hypothetical protein